MALQFTIIKLLASLPCHATPNLLCIDTNFFIKKGNDNVFKIPKVYLYNFNSLLFFAIQSKSKHQLQ